MHLAICRRKTFFTCCINSYNMSQLKCFFIIAIKTLKMAFEVSREVLPDKAFLIASVQMAPQLKCWQPVWGDRPFLISSFYAWTITKQTSSLLLALAKEAASTARLNLVLTYSEVARSLIWNISNDKWRMSNIKYNHLHTEILCLLWIYWFVP